MLKRTQPAAYKPSNEALGLKPLNNRRISAKPICFS